MAKFTEQIVLKDNDKSYIKDVLKPYLQKNDMKEVRRTLVEDVILSGYGVSGKIICWLLQELGENTYFMNSSKTISEEFYDCEYLSQITIPYFIKLIGRNTFSYCDNLIHITLPGVETIEDRAFANCSNLKKIVLPRSLKYLNIDAFDGCNEDLEILIPREYVSKEDNGVIERLSGYYRVKEY